MHDDVTFHGNNFSGSDLEDLTRMNRSDDHYTTGRSLDELVRRSLHVSAFSFYLVVNNRTGDEHLFSPLTQHLQLFCRVVGVTWKPSSPPLGVKVKPKKYQPNVSSVYLLTTSTRGTPSHDEHMRRPNTNDAEPTRNQHGFLLVPPPPPQIQNLLSHQRENPDTTTPSPILVRTVWTSVDSRVTD